LTILTGWIERLGREVVTQPLSVEVPSCQEEYFASVGPVKLGFRVLGRKLSLIFWGQSALRRQHLNPEWKKCLWIYTRTAQVGDSLMDLACRNIYKEIGITVDLLTTQNLSELYRGDIWFNKISHNPDDFLKDKYDFIIVQSIHHRSLKFKVKYFKPLPWVCIQEFFDVPDFSRTEWGARRVFDLARQSPSLTHFEYSSRQKFSNDKVQHQKQHNRPLVIAVGGVDAVRTYTHWRKVVEVLATQNVASEVCLIGSGKSAEAMAEEILTLANSTLRVENQVGKTSLADCFTILCNANIFLAADGGLLHLAVAASAKRIIGLFIVGIPPELRIPMEYRADALISSTGDVNDIDIWHIANKITSKSCDAA